MNKTGIDYLTHTWNPIKMRCDPVSPGCTHCWHLTVCDNSIKNSRIPEKLKEVYRGGSFYLDEKELVSPLQHRTPARIGVQFMGDLFHESVPFEWIDRVMEIIGWSPWHTFQFLTKRPDRMAAYFGGHYSLDFLPLPNLWLGVTAENQEMADERIPILLDIPAAVRVVSVEPTLEEIGIAAAVLQRLDWVIIGAESGPRRRPCKTEWVSRLGILCNCAGVPWYVKQIQDINGKVVRSPANWPQEFPQ